jgi:hypothetical protein
MPHALGRVHARAHTIAVGSLLSIIGSGSSPSAQSAEPSERCAGRGDQHLVGGIYENCAQVKSAKTSGHTPPPQLVTITIETTPQRDRQLWHVHMDVDPEVALQAGSDTSLDAL